MLWLILSTVLLFGQLLQMEMRNGIIDVNGRGKNCFIRLTFLTGAHLLKLINLHVKQGLKRTTIKKYIKKPRKMKITV